MKKVPEKQILGITGRKLGTLAIVAAKKILLVMGRNDFEMLRRLSDFWKHWQRRRRDVIQIATVRDEFLKGALAFRNLCLRNNQNLLDHKF